MLDIPCDAVGACLRARDPASTTVPPSKGRLRLENAAMVGPEGCAPVRGRRAGRAGQKLR